MKNIIMSPRASLKWVVRENVEEAKRVTSTYNLTTRCTTPDNVQHVLDDNR